MITIPVHCHLSSLFPFASPRIYRVASGSVWFHITKCTLPCIWTCVRTAVHTCHTQPSFFAQNSNHKLLLAAPCFIHLPSHTPVCRNTHHTPSPRPSHTCRYLSFEFRTAASAMKSNSVASSRKAQTYGTARRHSRSLHWLFRSNIPRRRNSNLSVDIRKRNFFGMGEIMQVLVNPKETIRSLTESRRLLDEARQEISEHRERSQLRTKHTFSRLPGFYPRPEETRAIENSLDREPSFTVLFGSSSVGKTAILREILSKDKYHVLHFDLRIAGFADLPSLYTSLSQQMEQYFEEIAKNMEGYEEFEKEAWGFKYDRLNVEQRISDSSTGPNVVKTSDIARLMELFQSSLLRYWEFNPAIEKASDKPRRQDSDRSLDSDRTRVEQDSDTATSKRRWGFKKSKKGNNIQSETLTQSPECDKENVVRPKKMPVLFFDEAHKLPTLIRSRDSMKSILDSILVLTKQDRLCHVVHATSDPFYQTWLRQLSVVQHCKIITIGDCSKAETRAFFRDRVLPQVPERIRVGLDFEVLFDALGGKLAHWQDYVAEYVNANGHMDVKRSSHFLHAHSLLNLHIIHSSQAAPPTNGGAEDVHEEHNRSTDTIHPALGQASLKVYSPTQPSRGGRESGNFDERANVMVAGYYNADFTAMQLLKVMSRLTQPDVTFLPYFLLCREIGVRAVDGMVKGKVLDLRWTEPVSKEGNCERSSRRVSRPIVTIPRTMGDPLTSDVAMLPEEQILPVDEDDDEDDQDDLVVGPKLVPASPIMRYAMREVVQEYEDEQSVSEYASLSDVDEY